MLKVASYDVFSIFTIVKHREILCETNVIKVNFFTAIFRILKKNFQRKVRTKFT